MVNGRPAPSMLRLFFVTTGLALLAAPALAEGSAGPPPGDAPPQARPGECYARITVPAVTETYEEQVLVEEGREVKRVIPARVEPRTREIVVREESRRVEVTPPVYETVAETVVVRPGFAKTVVEPAQVRVVRERVASGAPRRVWKLVHGPHQPGPMWRLVEEPAPTKVIERKVVLAPERVRTVHVPPEHMTVPREVLRRPAETREVVEPAVVKRVTTQEVVEPARVEVSRSAPVYAPVTRSRVVAPERREWIRVLCEADADAPRIKRIQGRLRDLGYYRGGVDGLYGPATAEAVSRFQLDRDLPHEGYLSWPTLEALKAAGPDTPAAPAPRADRG